MEHTRSTQDKILWELASHNGRLTKSSLRHRMTIKQSDLDSLLDELAEQGKIKRTESGADKRGRPKQTITLI
ncbi:MAG: MarR family transcriptional regulator [Methanotrichaceae archaeon]|nr:MarR family transcriptional regulator [Methanotrichaceae archaeon]